VSDLFF